jgi:hypothetical protein
MKKQEEEGVEGIVDLEAELINALEEIDNLKEEEQETIQGNHLHQD